mgnify:CR=1 FL=1
MSSPIDSSQWMYASGGFYDHTIDQSLRFNDDDSAYLRKQNFSGSPTSDQTCTFSVWVKLTHDGSRNAIYGSSTGSNAFTSLSFKSDGELDLRARNSSSTDIIDVISNAVFRDPSAWYHVMSVYDMTNATRANRAQIYINGVRITDLSDDTLPNNTTTDFYNGDFISDMQIGRTNTNSSNMFYADFYLAEYHRVDGQALTPSSFGETKSGIWIPKRYSGSYGNHGFYLNFADTSDIGKDVSGNGNDFTPNNLAATDVVPDSPTNNWCTLNPLTKPHASTITFSEGNLKSSTAASTAAAEHGATFTIPKSGKWYWEADFTGAATNGSQAAMMGIMDIDTQTIGLSGNHINNTTGDYVSYYTHNSAIYENNTLDSGFSGNESAATVGFAFDIDNGYLFIHLNGTYIGGTPNFSTGANHAAEPNTTRTWLPWFGANGGGTVTWTANFGQDSANVSSANSDSNGRGTFEYEVPSGYLALCSANLPDPAIDPAEDATPADHFSTILYTGNASSRSLTGVGFQPDWVWTKDRDDGDNHVVHDSVRGVQKRLYINTTSSEADRSSAGGGSDDGLVSFDSDGFSIGDWNNMNQNSIDYVAWNWKAGTAFSNDASATSVGTIDSTGSVNTTAGFSIISYTGNGSSSQTVAHGLSSTPEIIFHKDRDTNSNNNQWNAYNAISGDDYGYLSTNAAFTGSAQIIPSGTTTIELKANLNTTNESGDKFIMYAFHSVEGYSKVGGYYGNGNVDGSFVYTGFRPAWIMLKKGNDTGHWHIWDSTRNTSNEVTRYLLANETNTEYTDGGLDIVSNGFKARKTGTGLNTNGDRYIYLAFAEQPFKYANAR